MPIILMIQAVMVVPMLDPMMMPTVLAMFRSDWTEILVSPLKLVSFSNPLIPAISTRLGQSRKALDNLETVLASEFLIAE